MKGQVSAEMLILLAVVVAVVALAATYLLDLGKSSGEHVEEQGKELLGQTEIGKRSPGEECDYDFQCESRVCDSQRCA